MKQQKSTSIPMEYATQGKLKRRDMSIIMYFCHKEFGHHTSNFLKKFSNYFKEKKIIRLSRNVLVDLQEICNNVYPINWLFQYWLFYGYSISDTKCSCSCQSVTLEMIQQKITSGFSVLGLSSKSFFASSPQYFNSTTSNHMTENVHFLTNVNKWKLQRFILLTVANYPSQPSMISLPL